MSSAQARASMLCRSNPRNCVCPRLTRAIHVPAGPADLLYGFSRQSDQFSTVAKLTQSK